MKLKIIGLITTGILLALGSCVGLIFFQLGLEVYKTEPTVSLLLIAIGLVSIGVPAGLFILLLRVKTQSNPQPSQVIASPRVEEIKSSISAHGQTSSVDKGTGDIHSSTHRWIREGKTLSESAKEKQDRVEARLGVNVKIETLGIYYELIQNNEPGSFSMYAIDGKAYIIAKMGPPPSDVENIFRNNIKSGHVVFVSSCHTYPTYPMTYLRIFVPLGAGPQGTAKGPIIESPTNFTNANFQEWVCTLEATKKTMLLVYDENGNVIAEGSIDMEDEIINKMVGDVDQANIALSAIPKEQRDFLGASQMFFRDHTQPFL